MRLLEMQECRHFCNICEYCLYARNLIKTTIAEAKSNFNLTVKQVEVDNIDTVFSKIYSCLLHFFPEQWSDNIRPVNTCPNVDRFWKLGMSSLKYEGISIIPIFTVVSINYSKAIACTLFRKIRLFYHNRLN